MTRMTVASCLLAATLAAVDFDGLQCEQKELAAALVGRKMTTGSVEKLVRKYSKLKLKDLGAETVGDDAGRTSLVFWQLCDRNVVMVVDHDKVTDAIEFPLGAKEPDSKMCKGKEPPGDLVVRMLKPSGEPEKAWRVGRTSKKLEPISPDGLVCSAD